MTIPPDSIRPRFIAGARCPQCQQQDRLVLYRRDGCQYRECVACGFMEEMQFEPSFRELETRVNRTEMERIEDISAVRILDPGKEQGAP